MSKTPLNEENKELELDAATEAEKETTAVQEKSEDSKKSKKKARKSSLKKKSKIPENETEEERKEREKKEEAKKKQKPKDIKQATKRLIKYITKYKFMLVVIAILVVLTTVISVLASLAMLPVYQVLEGVISGENPDGASAMKEIAKWLIIMAVGYGLSALFNVIYTRIMLHVSSNTLMNMRRDLFNHIQGLPLEL